MLLACATQGTNSAAVAEVARLFENGALTKQDGGALHRISQALFGLISRLVNSLEEFRDAENSLELETGAGTVNYPDDLQYSVSVEARPHSRQFLVSEYSWESGVSDLRELIVSKGNVIIFPERKDMFFASHGFVSLSSKNCEGRYGNELHQQIGLYDMSGNQWHIPPLWMNFEKRLSDCSCVSFCGISLREYFT